MKTRVADSRNGCGNCNRRSGDVNERRLRYLDRTERVCVTHVGLEIRDPFPERLPRVARELGRVPRELACDELTATFDGHRFEPGEGDGESFRKLAVGQKSRQRRKEMAS
jgi:hypothetical protein